MAWFTSKKRVGDERIVQLQNVIYREMYTIVSVLCLLSIAVKYYMYGIDVKQVAIELIILLVQGLYYLGRAMSLGIISDEIEIHDRASGVPMSKKNVWIGLGTGSVLALFFGVRSAIVYGDTLSTQLAYFASVFFASFMIYVPLFVIVIMIYHYAAKKAGQKSAEEEEDE